MTTIHICNCDSKKEETAEEYKNEIGNQGKNLQERSEDLVVKVLPMR